MKHNGYQKKQRKMRQQGWEDFHSGKSILEDFPGHGERERAEWEIGWRGAKDGGPKPYEEMQTQMNTKISKPTLRKIEDLLNKLAPILNGPESQIKFPLHAGTDAQGEMGILDDKGQAVAMMSDAFTPSNGYVWEPEKQHVPWPTGYMGTTCYSQRCLLVKTLCQILNEIKT